MIKCPELSPGHLQRKSHLSNFTCLSCLWPSGSLAPYTPYICSFSGSTEPLNTMSSSIAIPKRRKRQIVKDHNESPASSSSPSSAGTSYASPSKSPVKEPALVSPSAPIPNSTSSLEAAYLRDRRPSLLSWYTLKKPSDFEVSNNEYLIESCSLTLAGPSIAKADYAVVNVGSAEAPRLVRPWS